MKQHITGYGASALLHTAKIRDWPAMKYRGLDDDLSRGPVTTLEFEGRIEYATRDHDKITEHARRWREAGASHLSVNTMHAGLTSVDAHIGALGEMAQLLL